MDVTMNSEDNSLVINMDANAKEHLEFEVSEDFDGTFRVIDHLCGGKIIYAGFPTREDAEKFVLSQPECWE